MHVIYHVFNVTDYLIGVIFLFRSTRKSTLVCDRWAKTLITDLNILYIDEFRIDFKGRAAGKRADLERFCECSVVVVVMIGGDDN